MATVFTKIIEGELPGRFVWADEACVGFLSINPLRPGHTLLVPRAEIDHWLDVPADVWSHLMQVSQTIGQGLQRAFEPTKVGLMLAGLEVPHCHIHLVPIATEADLNFANADRDPSPTALDDAHRRLREALVAVGARHVPEV